MHATFLLKIFAQEAAQGRAVNYNNNFKFTIKKPCDLHLAFNVKIEVLYAIEQLRPQF